MKHPPLRRMIGGSTALLLGMGVAIGSGIFRTPGEVAGVLDHPLLILAAWLLGGLVLLCQSLVTAELATRFPRAGGEYVYLREAYGEFAAFFCGWAFTVFVIGMGAATIASAFGDFAASLLNLDGKAWAAPLASAAVVAVVGVNLLGLRAGAGMQNVLTAIKAGALLVISACCLIRGDVSLSGVDGAAAGEAAVGAAIQSGAAGAGVWTVLSVVLTNTLWPYEGSTDAAKLAEEIDDVQRALPRALIGSTFALIAIYLLYNLALMRMVPLAEMRGEPAVAGLAMRKLFGPVGERALLMVAMLTCLGALSSTLLATIRVTFALSRDRLAPRFLSVMSNRQQPVWALVAIGGLAAFAAGQGSFQQNLSVYALAAAILFGLSYGSLLIFRRRDAAAGADNSPPFFRCPAGIWIAIILIAVQLIIAGSIIAADVANGGHHSLLTVALLAVIAGFYRVWKRVQRNDAGDQL